MTIELVRDLAKALQAQTPLIRGIACALRKPGATPSSPFVLGGLLALGSPAAAFELADLDGSNGFIIDVDDDFAETGDTGVPWSGRWPKPIGAAGDVNGDGIADFLIGKRDLASGSGRAYVVFGRTGP